MGINIWAKLNYSMTPYFGKNRKREKYKLTILK
jgi:hypothetical protein